MKNKNIIIIILIILIIPLNVFALGNNSVKEKRVALIEARENLKLIKDNLIQEKKMLKEISDKNKLVKSLLNEKRKNKLYNIWILSSSY